MSDLEPPPSREYAAALAGEELAAYAFIRAWMAYDVDKGMLRTASRAARGCLVRAEPGQGGPRALLSAEGYQVDRALAVLDQWMETPRRGQRYESHA